MALSRISNNSVSNTNTIDQSKITGLTANISSLNSSISSNVSSLTSIIDTQAFNIGLLGFKLAVQNGLTVYNLKDGIVDEFASTAGVGTSPGGTYNPSSSPGANNYSNQASSSYNANYTTTAITGPGAPLGTAASQSSAPTSFGSFTAPPSINGGVTAYVFGAGGMGSGIGSSPTLYNFGIGGGGGFASGAFPVAGGSTVYLAVGSGGPASGPAGSFNGGNGNSLYGGGGLVGVFSTTYASISAPSAIIVAGSGGAGYASIYAGGIGQYGGADGGGGGGTQAKRGGDQSATTSSGPHNYPGNGEPGTMSGGGGSQSSGGTGGSGSASTGSNGSLFTGGNTPGGGGGGAGYYGGGGSGGNPGGGGGAGRGAGGGGGGSSYYGNPIVTSGATTSAASGPAGGSYNSGGASSPFYNSPATGRGGQGPGTPAPGNVAGGDGYVVLTWSTLVTSAATITSSTFATLNSLVPTKARLVIFQDNISPDTATINTDLVASVSRDNGTTFTTVTLTNSGYITGASGQKILTGTADISGQPSGGNMKWKIVAQTKGQKIYGVSLQWV